MTTQEQIYNWLITGLQQSAIKFTEVFYYDKRDKQFFSILLTDYHLFDGAGELKKDASSCYSEANLILLTDRIRRINIDPQILSIPRLGDTGENYLQQADSFLNLNSINIDDSTIWEVEESGPIKLNFK